MTKPIALLASLPATVPFVGPEALARRAGTPPGDLLRLGANESTFGPAPEVVAALGEAAASVRFYGDPEVFELRSELARKLDVGLGAVAVAGGIDELLGLFVRAYLRGGDVALMTAGSYPTFAYHVRGSGGVVQTAEYRDGRLDLAALGERASRLRPAVVYIANPDNPSGSLCDPLRLGAFLEELPRTTLVLLDEAYAEYAGGALPERVPSNVVRLRTFSKAYGLAGLRVGYAFGDPDLIEPLEKIRLHFGVGPLAQLGALTALARPAYVASVVAETEAGRDDYARIAAGCGLSVHPSATNFVLFELGDAARAEALVPALLAQGVFVRKPGAGTIASCVRVTIGTSVERRRFGEALARALEGLAPGSAR